MFGSQITIPKIICNKGGNHQNEVINNVCLNKTCIDRGNFLLCIVCSTHQHENHEQIPAKLLLNEILLQLNNTPTQKVISDLNSQKNVSLNLLNELRQNFNEKMNTIENSIIDLFNKLKENLSIKSYEFQTSDIQQFVELFQCAKHMEEVKHALREMLNRVVMEKGSVLGLIDSVTKDSIIADLNYKNKDLQRLLTDMNSQINTLFERKNIWIDNLSAINQNSNFNSAANYFDKSQPNKFKSTQSTINSNERDRIVNKSVINQDHMSFTLYKQDFKHEGIEINQKTITNLGYYNETQHYRVQLLQPSLEASLAKIQNWTFKITESLPNWIGLGIAHKNHCAQNDYQYEKLDFSINNGIVDHGMYILSSNGWAFSYENMPFRGIFGFTKGDVITLRFDPYMSMLIFYKNNDFSEPFNLEFTSICWNKLYPCVVFWYPKDQVELI